MLWEMRVHDRGKKRPASVPCAVDADSADARVLVEEAEVHGQERENGAELGCLTPMRR